MARRALLRDVAAGIRSVEDVCDAHPDLVRAGLNIGTPARDACPICKEEALRQVTYVFGGRKPVPGGRAVPRDSLAQQVQRHGDLNVYTVEVCGECHWHHLLESYWVFARGTAVG